MAIDVPLYAQVMTGTGGIKVALEEVAAAERAELAALNFSVDVNRSLAYVERIKNKALVNVLLYSVEPDTQRSSTHQQIDRVTYHINMYVKGSDDNLNPSDEAAMTRLHLLTAQVRYAVTQLKNKNFGLAIGKIDSRVGISIQYFPHDTESASVYAPARLILTLHFPYQAADTAPRAPIESINTTSISADDLEVWSTRYVYD